jgi:4-fold beta flower protein
METILYNKIGEAVAYIAADYHRTIYLWEGLPVAYLFDEGHLYGLNGRHLGWFKDEVIYNHDGVRVGFTSSTCPVSIAKPRPKGKKAPRDEIRPRWNAPALAKLGFKAADQDLADFLSEGSETKSVDS